MLSQDDVIYMIVTDRFCDGDLSNDADVDRSNPMKRHGGDLLGIIQRMPYLRDLGVTALWITPVYLNPTDDYHGYHPLDFEKVDGHLCSPQLGPNGSSQNVRRFVEIAHEHGLKVLLDIIVSHTALNHPWLKERPDWFDTKGSTLPEKWWIWGLPHLNHDNINVNLYFVKNVLDWITESGANAIRIDAARHVEKQFWPIFKLFAKGLHPNVTVVGEVWDQSPSVVAPYQDHYGFDSMFDYPLYHAILDVFTKDQSFMRLARPELSDNEPEGILNQDRAYRNACQLVTFIGNHDNPRFLHLAGGADGANALTRLKLAMSFLFTTRGIPQLYYGDELGMDGGFDPDNRRDVPWHLIDDDKHSSTDARRATEIRQFVQHLIRVRRSSKAFCYGLLTTLYSTPTLYAFARTFFDDVRIVVLNNSWEVAEVDIPIQANTKLPVLTKKQLPDGLILVDELKPNKNDQTRIAAGSLHVRLDGKRAVIFSPSATQKA